MILSVWSAKCQVAFEELKDYLMNSPILAPLEVDRPLYVSATLIALGAMLAQ